MLKLIAALRALTGPVLTAKAGSLESTWVCTCGAAPVASGSSCWNCGGSE